MAALRRQEGISARALEFAILTAARTGDVIGARWVEINLAEKLWTIPAERMKAGKEHRAPLSTRALAILEELAKVRECDFVFPGCRHGRPISNMARLMTLRRMGRGDLTAHGFRSSFRDWEAERTTFPAEVAEMAPAHTVSDKVEAAYRRGDLIQKRRQLSEVWAKFCTTPATDGRVVPIRPAIAAKIRRYRRAAAIGSFCASTPGAISSDICVAALQHCPPIGKALSRTPPGTPGVIPCLR